MLQFQVWPLVSQIQSWQQIACHTLTLELLKITMFCFFDSLFDYSIGWTRYDMAYAGNMPIEDQEKYARSMGYHL